MVLAPVLGLLWSQGFTVIVYLDNVLLREQSTPLLDTNVSLVMGTLERFGRVLNWQKSALVPAQVFEYHLVLILDTSQGKCFSLWFCLTILGEIVTSEVVTFAQFHSRPL